MSSRHFPVVCALAVLLGLGLVGCSSSEKIAAMPDPLPVNPDPPPVNPDPSPVNPDPSPVNPDPLPVNPDPLPVNPAPPGDQSVPPTSPPAVSAETGSNSDYDLVVTHSSTFNEDGREASRTWWGELYHSGHAYPFATGTETCDFIFFFNFCTAFSSGRQAAFQFPEVAFLNEDGSFVRDADDGVLDGMHNGSQTSSCLSNKPCTERILWREFSFTESTRTAPDTVEVHVFMDHGETQAAEAFPEETDAYPIPDHLNYLKLGYWMISESGDPWEYGGAFYTASPDYSIAIDSTTRGIRGTAQYDGRTVGVASLIDTNDAAQWRLGSYEGRVTLVADFGATNEIGNSFTISGRVEELGAENRVDGSEFSTFLGFDLGQIDGDVVGGAIRTSQGAVSGGADDVSNVFPGGIGELSGTWDVSFHGKANRTRIPGTNAYFHLAPPVVAGNIRAQGTYSLGAASTYDVTYDGVFGAYKTDGAH